MKRSKTTYIAAHSKQGSEKPLGKKEERQQAKRKKRFARIAKISILVLVIVAAIVALIGWLYLQGIDSKIAMDIKASEQLNKVLVKPETPKDPYYMLLVGSDSRDPENSSAGRSDSIILVRVDPTTPTVSLLSIPRDTKIELEGYGTQKINAAFAYYGPAGSVTAVSKLCDVQISHYIEIDFAGLVSIVDKLGGIEVNVPVDISLKDDFIPKGKQRLDGYHALIMCRSRSFPNGDFQRMNNQRIVLQAIAREVLSSSKLELPGLVSELAGCVKTNASAVEAIQMLMQLQGMDTKESLYMATVPSHTSNINGISYVEVYQEAFLALLEKFKAGLPLELDK